MTLIGAAAGGVLIARFSILSILFIGGAASAATNLLFAMLAQLGLLHAEALPSHDVISLVMALDSHVLMLAMTITLDNFSGGLAASACRLPVEPDQPGSSPPPSTPCSARPCSCCCASSAATLELLVESPGLRALLLRHRGMGNSTCR